MILTIQKKFNSCFAKNLASNLNNILYEQPKSYVKGYIICIQKLTKIKKVTLIDLKNLRCNMQLFY